MKLFNTCFMSAFLVVVLSGCIGSGRMRAEKPNQEEFDKQLEVPKEIKEKFAVYEKKGAKSKEIAPEPEDTKPGDRKKGTVAAKKPKKKKIRTATEAAKTASGDNKLEKVATKKIKKGRRQVQNRRKGMKDAFRVGEEVQMEASYLGLTAGILTMKVLRDKVVDGRDVYHFKGIAESTSVFGYIYRVYDYIESFVDKEGFYPYRFAVFQDESRQKRKALEIFDFQKRKASYWSRREHVRKGLKIVERETPIKDMTMDALTSIFYLRSHKFAVGKKIVFDVVSQGKAWEATAKILRKEKITVEAGTFNTFVVKPETRFGGVLKKKGDVTFWFTDDPRHFLVKLEAKIKIGAVKAEAVKIIP